MAEGLVDMGDHIAVHPDPVWRDRADFLVRARVDDGWEQIWSRKLADGAFEVCCIPFFVHDLALGDIVDTESVPGSQYAIKAVREESGHRTYRAWFGDSPNPERTRADVMDFVTQSGCLFEVSSEHMLAIDAPAGKDQLVADELWRREQAGELVYETGKS